MKAERLAPQHLELSSAIPAFDASAVGGQQKMGPRVKRMVFVASLYFFIRGTNNPTPPQLDEVNRKFRLACRSGALLFPAAVAGILWKGADLSDITNQYRDNRISVQQLTTKLLSKAPGWLLYGNQNVISQDVKAIFDESSAVV